MPGSIGRDEVRQMARKEGAIVAEVLPRPEYDWAHIAGAVHLPLKGLSHEGADEVLEPERPVIVYCNNTE